MQGTRRYTTKVLTEQLPSHDHRVVGARQNLFFFDLNSKGSVFFKPRGAHIFNKLVEFIRNQYASYGYQEVQTPTLFDNHLWRESGHWEHYRDNMHMLKVSKREYALKPMNCPAHCLIYKNNSTSSDDLPQRYAEIATLHRNEFSGGLLGLTRLRRFHQDDAHIFCRPDQIENEIIECLDLTRSVYKKFNLDLKMRLSLRPTDHLGESSSWDIAENALRSALKFCQIKFTEQALEGAFYGPKIDSTITDNMGRDQQCATIQLDFQLPQRFNLTYRADENSNLRPVIIHRAILGSLERFMAMLCENCRGRWPFWMSPLQAQVIPVHDCFNDYARDVYNKLKSAKFWVDVDLRRGETLKAKIRDASMMPYNLILIVGKQESESSSVTSRGPNGKNINIQLDELIKLMSKFERDYIDRADIELQK